VFAEEVLLAADLDVSGFCGGTIPGVMWAHEIVGRFLTP
jgi:hypothetical protein